MSSKRSKRAAVAAIAVIGVIASVGLTAPSALAADTPWTDTSLGAEQRAELLLAASSQHQKYRWLNEQAANSPQQTTFGSVVYPAQLPGTPKVVYTDGPDGVRFTAGVTAFPAPIAFAAGWDLELNEAKSAAQAAEAFDKGKNGVLGPGLASGRTPLSGRTPEYFGEDPLLTGLLTAGAIHGLQNVDGKPVMADVKHYVANEQELDRQTSSSNMSERTLRQAYDLPVEIALAESNPASVMCSYNQINGVYGCENPILTTNLKGQMGFEGYVVSDFGAVHSTAAALNGGLDQELNRPRYFTPTLLDAALAAGEITQERIDDAARRVVTAYIANGLFDTPLPDTPVADASSAEHKSIARTAAEQGSVLLKNNGLLPLDLEPGAEIAVIGATASSTPTGGVSATTTCSMDWRGGNTLQCEDLVAPEQAIRDRAAEVGATVTFDSGADLGAAAMLAASADVAIVFGYQKMGEFADVADLKLQGNGDALVEAIASANANTVVVLNTGSAVEMPWLDSAASVLETWYAGEQVGPAVAALLWGDVNPSGKLPMTFPKALADTPTGTDTARYPGVFSDGSTVRPVAGEIRQVNYTEGLEIGYKWYDEQDIAPLFEFGHGLSYTEFAYSDLVVTPVDGGVKVSFTVRNTGDMAGAEVPQVYLTLPAAAEEPGKRLVGFDRIELEAGAQASVDMTIAASASNRPFSIWDVDADEWTTVSGGYDVEVGASSRDIRLDDSFVLDVNGASPEVELVASPASPDGDAGWYVSTVEVSVTATDDVDPEPGIEVNVDGAGWTPYEGALRIESDGEHSVTARATDSSGNVSEEVAWSGKLDGTAPVVTAAAEGRSVTLSASDATSGVASIEWAQQGAAGTAGSWMAYVDPITVAEGAAIVFRATDVAGNVSVTGEYGDVVAVEASISVDPKSARPGDTVTVTGSDIAAGDYTLILRSDPVTVASITVSAAGSFEASFEVPRSTAPGAHTVQLVSADGTVVATAALEVLSSGSLASTGASLLPIGVLIAALLSLMLGTAIVIRRRARATAQ